MTAIRNVQVITNAPRLHVSFELSWDEWKLGFTTAPAQPARLRTVRARDLAAVLAEIAKAKKRFGLPADAEVVSCYEAGRDGFWLHRWLLSQGITNYIVDSSSIEVNRKKRHAKTDGLDAASLLNLLLRYLGGEKKAFSAVRVPSVADEDRRQLHRELIAVQNERTKHINSLKGMLASQGLVLACVYHDFPEELAQMRLWDGSKIGPELQARLLREFARWQLADRQVKDLENERKKRIKDDDTPHVEKVRRLLSLKGIGLAGSWLFVYELFAWRKFDNRRQVGAIAGLTPTPYQSGKTHREQGISKAGNRDLRRMLVELAWTWRRWQPNSALTQWFEKHFAKNGPRARKVGIVAVARKLLIALWKYLEHGEKPPGAELVGWRTKFTGNAKKTPQAQAA